MTVLNLMSSCKIDEDIISRLLEHVKIIEKLNLRGGTFSYFNLDNLFNLRELSLIGKIDSLFNFGLLRNLCKQLESVNIDLRNIREKTFKLFEGCHFPYLVDFRARSIEITVLRKEFLNRFPIIRNLNLCDCYIDVIEHKSFSNLQQLRILDLSRNQIKSIEKNAFSALKNLEKVNLSYNKLGQFDPTDFGLSTDINIVNINFSSRNEQPIDDDADDQF